MNGRPPPKPDPAEIRRAMGLILAPGQVTEVRALEVVAARGWSHVESGYYDDLDKLARDAGKIERAKGIYFTPNPVNPALLARAVNRIRPVGKEPTTSDHDIVGRRWLLIDADPVRPAGISSTDAMHEAAQQKAAAIRKALHEEGWPWAIIADSGNGAHVLFRVNLPRDDGGLVQRCLEAIGSRFNDEAVKIDTSVHNPARIWRLYGTPACKGDDTPERPHRVSKIIDAPASMEVVRRELLEALAATAPQPDANTRPPHRSDGRFNIEQWIHTHTQGLGIRGPEPWQGGRKWIFEICPWNPGHTNQSAFIAELANGAIAAGCHHNGCAGKDWHALRDVVEPGWRGRGAQGPSATPSDARPKTPTPLPPFVGFPVDALPDPARGFVSTAAKAIGCDPSYIALPLLSGLAAAIGNTRSIELKRGWTEPAVVWTAIVGESGTLKSPAIYAALRPIHTRQERLINRYKKEVDAFKDETLDYEKALAEWQRNKRAMERPEKPKEPVCERVWCSDITVEALAVRLSENPRGLFLSLDELAGWFKSFDAYRNGRGGDVAHWLSMHSARDLLVDRKTGDRKIIFAPRAAVSITGGIQPAVLQGALSREHFEDGLAARFLLAMPPCRQKRWTEQEISPALQIELTRLFERLWEIQPDLDDEENPHPHVLQLTADAKSEWVTFYNAHAQEQARLTGDLAAAWSKIEGYAARLALVVHLVRWAAGDSTLPHPDAIDAQSVSSGVRLSQWFGQEAWRIYEILGESEEGRGQRRLVELIERKGGRISSRELRQSDRRFRDSAEAAEAALDKIVKAGLGRWAEVEPSAPGGRPTRFFALATVSTSTKPPADSPPLTSDNNFLKNNLNAFLPPQTVGGFVDVDPADPLKKNPDVGDEEVEWTS